MLRTSESMSADTPRLLRCLIPLALLGAAGSASAQFGALDVDFGDGGSAITNFGEGAARDLPSGIAITQPDGKIVVAGRTLGGLLQEGVLLRYLPTGDLDPYFGDDGVVKVAGGTASHQGFNDIALDSQGRILVCLSQASRFDVMRFLPNGSLDPGFGDGGSANTASISGLSGMAVALATQGDKVVAVGAGHLGSQWSFTTVRYDAYGVLDSSFGQGGMVMTELTGSSSYPRDVAIDGTRIVVGGQAGADYMVACYQTSDGQPYPGFGGPQGYVLPDYVGPYGNYIDYLGAVAFGPQGSILVGGTVATGYQGPSHQRAAVARLTETGALDESFGDNGWALDGSAQGGSQRFYATDLAVMDDGGAVLAGATTSSSRGWSLLRFTPGGAPDANFDGDGKVVTQTDPDTGSTLSTIYALDVDSDGRLVCTGNTRTLPNYEHNIAVGRYAANGSLDLTFGGDGIVETALLDDFSDELTALVIQPDGKIIAAGSSWTIEEKSWSVARYFPDGTLDLLFGTNGLVKLQDLGAFNAITLHGAALQSTGKILLVGQGDGNNNGFIIVRLLADGGGLDPDFGPAPGGVVNLGLPSSSISRVRVLDDDRIIVGGFAYSTGTQSDFVVARLSADGVLDPDFGEQGFAVADITGAYERLLDLVIQPNGRILAVGRGNQGQKVLARFESEGGPDLGFGNFGTLNLVGQEGGNEIALLPDGKFLTGGTNWYVLMHNPDGSLDTTFEDGSFNAGRLYPAVRGAGASMAVDPRDGSVYIGGAVNGSGPAVAHYLTDWTLDPDFGDAGVSSVSFPDAYRARGAELALQSNGKILMGGSIRWYPGYTNVDFRITRLLGGDSTPPVADAGVPQPVHVGQPAQLSGADSYDETTATADLLWDWSIFSAPVGSQPSLTGEFSMEPTFTSDVLNPIDEPYVLQLIVTDEAGNASEPSWVSVSSENNAPVAVAIVPPVVFVGDVATLDGIGSFDVDDDPITYSWILVSRPSCSSAEVVDATSPTASLTPDCTGSYTLEFVVADAWESSTPIEVTIRSCTPAGCATNKLTQVGDILVSMDPGQFDAKGHQFSLQNQVGLIVGFIDSGDTAQAIAHLEDLISRTDGVPELRGVDPKGKGQPHAADFVTDASAQTPIWILLTGARDDLSS